MLLLHRTSFLLCLSLPKPQVLLSVHLLLPHRAILRRRNILVAGRNSRFVTLDVDVDVDQLIFTGAPGASASVRCSDDAKVLPVGRCRYARLCSVNGDGGNAYSLSDAESICPSEEGIDHGGRQEGGPLASNETLKKLKRYGIAGILSYGLLNTAYYLTTFLLVWFYFAPAPGKMGYLAAVERFIKVMAMVWAGSQVTKLIRAGGALALAPFLDRGLSWFTTRYKFESQEKAFLAIVGFCFGLAILLFLAVTMISA